MTTIDYAHVGNTFELYVSGHAGYNPGGPDIVCAACSILVYTLWDTLMEQQDTGALHGMTTALDDDRGVFTLRATCNDDSITVIDTIFTTVMHGFALLADKYPAFCKILVKNGEK